MTAIQYRGGYKYQLLQPYEHATGIPPRGEDVDEPFLALNDLGRLTIRAGYAWDGPSGPAIDTPDFMRASLVHDALYQLMRDGHVDRRFRADADALLRQICIEDGMSSIRAWWVYWGVRRFGARAAESWA